MDSVALTRLSRQRKAMTFTNDTEELFVTRAFGSNYVQQCVLSDVEVNREQQIIIIYI